MTTYGSPTPNTDEQAAPQSAEEALAQVSEQDDLSLLKELTQEASRDLENIVRYAVDTRPGWFAEFSANVSLTEFQRWQKAATKGKGNNQKVDIAIISQLPLVEKNIAIYKRGNDGELNKVYGKDGNPLTFKHDEFRDLFGASDLVAATKFLGDGLTVRMAQDLLDEAGYGGEVESFDPSNA